MATLTSTPMRSPTSADIQTPVRNEKLGTPQTGLSDAVSTVSSPGDLNSPTSSSLPVGPRKQLLFSSPGSSAVAAEEAGGEPTTPSERGSASYAPDVVRAAAEPPSDADVASSIPPPFGASTLIIQGLRVGIEKCDAQIRAVRRMCSLHRDALGVAASDRWYAPAIARQRAAVVLVS